MPNDERMTNSKCRSVSFCRGSCHSLFGVISSFVVSHSDFFRHSSFVIRHFVAFLLMTSIVAAADSSAKTDATIQKILRDVPLIDGHNDLPWQFHKRSN